MKKHRNGVYISVSSIVAEYENHISRLTSFIEKIQVEMSRIFATEVASAGVRYYHLFTGDITDSNNNENKNSIANKITISATGNYIINLYKGTVKQPDNIFHYCITL